MLIEAKVWAGLTGNQDDPTKQDRLIKGLDGFLGRDQDRALFDPPAQSGKPTRGSTMSLNMLVYRVTEKQDVASPGEAAPGRNERRARDMEHEP